MSRRSSGPAVRGFQPPSRPRPNARRRYEAWLKCSRPSRPTCRRTMRTRTCPEAQARRAEPARSEGNPSRRPGLHAAGAQDQRQAEAQACGQAQAAGCAEAHRCSACRHPQAQRQEARGVLSAARPRWCNRTTPGASSTSTMRTNRPSALAPCRHNRPLSPRAAHAAPQAQPNPPERRTSGPGTHRGGP